MLKNSWGGGNTLNYLLGVVLALATSGAWAGYVWTGAGNGYWGNSSNFNSSYSGGTGMFFRSGVNDQSGNEIVVVSNDVHFNGNKAFGYNFYVDRGTSLGVPATLAADTDAYGITVNSGLNVGTTGSSFGDGYLWIKNGTYSFNGVKLGQSASPPASSGYLTIGSSNRATTVSVNGDFVINKGKVTAENATISVGGDFAIDNGEVTIANGGTVEVSNDKFIHVSKTTGGTGTLNLLGGGKLVTCNVRKSGSTGYLVFDGGTLKANEEYPSSPFGGLIHGRVNVSVNAGGGVIDNDAKNITISAGLSGTGGLKFTGGGTTTLNGNVNYSGKTTVTPGTTLIIVKSTAKSNILANGLELVGAPMVGTPYTVFACDDTLSDADLANVTCGVASDFTAAIGTDGKSIVVTVAALKSGYWTGAKDNNLSDAANWSDNVVPTSGNPTIYCPVATTLTVGDTFAPATITIPDESAVVTIGAGDLTVATLTNACKLAIASGASLTVTGDLVVRDGKGTFLYSNEGSVTVGCAVCTTANGGGSTTTKQYEVVTANTQPIRTGGFLFDRPDTVDGHIYWRLESSDAGKGAWVVGANGFSFNAVAARQTRFYTQGNSVTLYSSANWTLDNSGKGSTVNGDLQVSAPLTIDTSDYDTPTMQHTVTLEGRIVANSPVTIKGCGAVVVDTVDMSNVTGIEDDLKHTWLKNGVTLSVTDTATLRINAGKKITGNGKVSLAAGTTLALDFSALGAIGDVEFVPCIPGLALPTTGIATIRINGRRLRSGDHVVATAVSGTAANVVPDLSSAALDGRRASFRVDNGILVLNIQSNGTKIVVR